MEALWEKSPLTPGYSVVAAVGEEHGWAPGTVKTLITTSAPRRRSRKPRGKAAVSPLLARTNYVQAESQSLVDRLFGGEVAPLVAHFAEHRALSPRDIALLKTLIAKLEDDE